MIKTIIEIKTINEKENFTPEYYYYDKVFHKIKDYHGNTIPDKYLTSIGQLQYPSFLISPYKVGLFKSGKLIGYYEPHSYFVNEGKIIEISHYLTPKQKTKPIIYKVFNLETKKPLLVKEPIEIIDYGTSGLEDAILERVKGFYNFPDNKSTKITVEDNKIIIEDESNG